MASPVGHALVGLAIGRSEQHVELSGPRLWIGCAALAVAPDLDFVPGIISGQPALYHQTWTHSLALALLVGGLAALALVPDRRRLPYAWFLFSAAYASHLLLDLFGADGRPPIGLPLFWPASDATYLSPLTLLPGIRHAATAQTATGPWLASVFSATNLQAIGIELGVAAPLLLLAELRRRRRLDSAGPKRSG
jgi:membrane-bound metal-dependent hydrolase YbcI (DUF457 family)